MLFLHDLFTAYEATLKTQTSIHALEQEEQHSRRLIHDPHGVAPSLHRPSQSGAKLPPIFNRERIESLEARVAELEQQLESEHAANHDITTKFKDLSVIVTQQ
jgi:HPt (histidine-containing phosphotransfer) domain-containing protein